MSQNDAGILVATRKLIVLMTLILASHVLTVSGHTARSTCMAEESGTGLLRQKFKMIALLPSRDIFSAGGV